MFLACLLATLALTPEDPAHEPTMLERIDALIAKSNAYEHFVARFHLTAADGQELAMRIVYRAPTDLLIDIQGEKFRSFNRIQASAIDCLRIQDGAPTAQATVRDWNTSARFVKQLRELIEREFPGALRSEDLPARESPTIKVSMASDDSSLSYTFGVEASSDPRLDWLGRARRRPERVSLDGSSGKELVLAYTEKSSLFISMETGFVTRIEKRTESGIHCGLELTSLDTASRPADSEFELPELGEGVQDISAGLADSLETQALSGSREDLFRTLARGLDAGRIEWTAQAPAKIERVMHAMYAVGFAPVCARLLAERKAVLEKYAEAYRDRFQKLDLHDPDVLEAEEQGIEQGRRKMEGSLSELLEREVTNGMPRGSCKARPSLYDELGALEKRILSELFAETVSKPLLAEFDEKVAKQLDAK